MLSNQSFNPDFNEVQVQQDIKTAIQILTNKAPSNQQVQKCNQVVIQHLKNSQSLGILLRVLIFVGDHQDQVNIVLSFIGHYLNVQSRPGVGVIRHNKDQICKKIKNVFFCKTISNKSKKMLQNSFSNFISTLSTDSMRLRHKLCEEIIQFFTQKQPTLADLNDSLFLVQALLTDNLQTENLILLEEALLVKFVQHSIELIRELDDYLIKEQNFNFSQDQLNKVIWTQKVLQITELLYSRAKTQRLLVLKMKVSISMELAHICAIGLKLSHQRNHFVFEIENYQNIEQKIFYEKIDEIKLNILTIMNSSFSFLLKSRKNLAEQKFIPVIETSKCFINEIIPMIENTLSGYPTKPIKNIRNIQEGLALLAKLIKIPVLLNQFTQIRNLVLWKICLPCFITTENQKKLACEDYCDKKQKNVAAEEALNITQAAVQVAESYFDNIYGSIPFTAKALINLMDFQLTADPKYFEEIPEPLSSSQFFNNFTYFQQFQAALSVMSAMSYHADNRQDVTVLLEQFVLRRQQFFSRIDVPVEMIVSFLQCCAYYLQNFYQLILSGKANADFHRALVFHSTELLAFSFDSNTKSFKNNDLGKIGTQAIDYLSNSLIQDHFFSAIFPAWNPKSTPLLVSLMQKISVFMNSTFNIKMIENILIDFVVRCTDRHFVDKNQFASMPEPLRVEISQILVDQILKNFSPHLKNESIAKQKLLQLYSLIIRVCKQPTKLMVKSLQLFHHIIQKQFSFIEQLLTIAEIYLKRNQRQSLNPTPQLTFVLLRLAQKSIKICDNDTFNCQVFNLFLGLNLIRVSQQEITFTLLETFGQRLQQRQTEQDAQLAMEKILYLLIQISFSNFFSVSPKMWLQVLRKMIDYLSQNYVRQDTIIIGKCTIICLSCYIQDPSGIQNVIGNKMEVLWDCILDDQLKYSTVAEKKIICILLTRLLGEHFSRPAIKDKYIPILTTVCIIMYYIYEKNQVQWKEENDDESMSQKDQDDQLYKDKAWKQTSYTTKQNPFVTNLPDDREMVKDLCLKLNQTDHNSFVKFVDQLPMGIQNLVKNKILMYKCDTGVANKKKMRTIYKVRVPDSQEIEEHQNKDIQQPKNNESKH